MAPLSLIQGQLVLVENLTTGTGHETISDAVSNASPGDHIELSANTFVEHVSISIPLTLSGAEGGGTLIDVSAQIGWGIALSADNITLEDVTILAGGINTEYAVHSEPGITGLTIEDVAVYDSNRSCIDLNGLTGPDINIIRNVTVSGSAIGFGLALSTCAQVLVENVTSIDNGFGDIGIMESNYYDQEITGLTFMGSLDLRGPESLGGGGIVVQLDASVIPAGIGPEFPININSDGFEQVIEAPGDLTGCIIVHNDDIRQIAATLGGTITDLIAFDMVTQNGIVYPGMKIQPALDNADPGQTIEVEAGAFDSIPLIVSSDVTLLGANSGIAADSASLRTAETLIPGIVVNGGAATLDGIRIDAPTGDAIEVAESASGLTLRNSLLIGQDAPGSRGLIARHAVSIEDSRISRFDAAILQTSGTLSVTDARLNANGSGVTLSGSGDLQLTVEGTLLENPGGVGLHVLAASASSQVQLTASEFDLHGTSIKTETAIGLTSTGSTFTNAEVQVDGLEEGTKLALCASNTFVPAMRIAGCMDPAAANYTSCATIDFGCEYPGCTSPKACNYDPGANVDDGSCDLISCAACPLGFACNYDPDADLYRVESCDFADCGEGMAESGVDRNGFSLIDGCTIPQACNYNPDADVEDGSCTFDCYGCLDTEACNYDATFTLASNETCLFKADLYPSAYVDCDGVCYNDANANGVCDEEEVSGCMDFGACNFHAEATLDDGQCDYVSCAGCTNAQACNYDSEALITDGSCDYESCKGCTDPLACNHDVEATLDDGTCTFPVDLYNKTYVDCDENCLNDENANGVCDEVEIPGCMDMAACLYDEDATIDDGSCDYTSCAGCTDPTACNYDPGATIDDGQCTHPEDLYPEFVVDGEAVVDCVGRCNNDADNDDVCDELEIPGCQDDSACNFNPDATDDDGSCFDAAEGYDCDGNCLEDTDGDGVCDPFEIDGCTDSAACNYAAEATEEDGNCTYPDQTYLDCLGNCLNDADGDGICDELEVSGCTDGDACNYDPAATDEDGSCIYPDAAHLDCDGNCLNDSDSDGVCDEFEVLGCTAYDACNYDPTATEEDGSCTYPAEDYLDCDGNCLNDSDGDGTCDELEPSCPGDLNGDGLRGAADILIILSSFGCTIDCGAPDLNGDGLVAANDILEALSTFGLACPE